MKNKLLITTALVATFYATNVWAVSYTDKVELEQGKTNYIAANSTIDSAIFDLEAVGEHVGNATRIGFKDAGTITISGDNTFRDFVTFEGNTSFTASGDTTPKMTVEGYMTSTRNADVDLSAVDVTISQGDGGSSVVQNYGGLIIDNDTTAFKVGNLTFDEGTNLVLYKAAENESEIPEASDVNSKMEIAEGKTLTFMGNNKIGTGTGKELFEITGAEGSAIDVNGKLQVAIKTSLTNTTFNVNKGGYLDLTKGSIESDSDVHFEDGSSLKTAFVETGEGEDAPDISPVIKANNITGSTALVIENGSTGGQFQLEGNQEEFAFANNALYDITADESGIYNVVKKATDEIAASSGANSNQASTISAITSGTTGNATFDAAANGINDLMQSSNANDVKAATDAATALAPEVAPMVQHTQTQTANQVFGAVGTRLSGGSISTGGQGMASGDNIFERASLWVQGLFNKSKLDDTASAKGFDADSSGIAMGAEKYINNSSKVGLGYAFTNTDIDGFMRSTDVDTHTAFVYGEYKPSNWYVNGIASYGWSDYSEDKTVLGNNIKSDYDAETFSLQAMTGYDMQMKNFGLTPEVGLRYVHISQDGYTDSADQKVSGNDSDILTGVIGAKVNKSFALENGMNLKPEARIAATYDLMNDDANSVVTLANGSAYTVKGEALDRFGMEFGAGITAEVNDNIEFSVGYEGKFREDYQDHTGLLNAKYNF